MMQVDILVTECSFSLEDRADRYRNNEDLSDMVVGYCREEANKLCIKEENKLDWHEWNTYAVEVL